jgi:plasmid stability protein
MGSLTISGLDERLVASLREQALRHGRSVEEEARQILEAGLAEAAGNPAPRSVGDAIHALFAPLGGVDLVIPPREPVRDPPDFKA